jgi:leucyl/phenylalanyl-tRNA---protein transferase
MSDRPLTPDLLRAAYARGYFPWPDPSGRIFWHRPDPRAILELDRFHVSRRLARRLRGDEFQVSFDRDFRGVMNGCREHPNSWLTPEILRAYGQMHDEGTGHSVEIWQDERLVGGTYGLALGGAFFAESMFHRVTDASKAALYHLVERLKRQGFALLEVQFVTPHLASLGATEISGDEYARRLAEAIGLDVRF